MSPSAPYCDFNSHKAGDPAQREVYLRALAADLKTEAASSAGREVETVFIGGGTPSLFTADQIGTLIDEIHATLDLADGAEVTLEANPGTVEHGRLAAYREAGVNRLSLGAQSFDRDMLRTLGRIHGPDDVFAAYEEARTAGFDSINLDLMHALPDQTVAMARADVERLVALAPEHVSYYQLTLEPNTRFHAHPPSGLPGTDLGAEIQSEGHAQLREAGYVQYEISAFCKPGLECRHNLNYWRFGDYLGVGAGAHGKVTTEAGRVFRNRKWANPAAYTERSLAGTSEQERIELGGEDRLFEFMLNATRLVEGFSPADFERATGLPFERVAVRLAQPEVRRLIGDERGRWRPTSLGFRFLNDLQAHFLPEECAQRPASSRRPRVTSAETVMHKVEG